MSLPDDPGVVVITSASSRATAQVFARCGAGLVLAARRVDMLNEAVRECEALGGIEMAMLPLRMADIGMTMATPILQIMVPPAVQGPVSR